MLRAARSGFLLLEAGVAIALLAVLVYVLGLSYAQMLDAEKEIREKIQAMFPNRAVPKSFLV